MIDTAQALAAGLEAEGLTPFKTHAGATLSHQFALEAAEFGGGQAASKHLRKAGFLACGIGLPIAEVAGDMNGLRIGTPELVRFGMTVADMPHLAKLPKWQSGGPALTSCSSSTKAESLSTFQKYSGARGSAPHTPQIHHRPWLRS
ncbi:serine hydroxymethyltransferase [Thalassovita autumnalis]|uniref:Serine hydroxymethyltransferase n=2 Tax=Thalassovita autumnalis TaxID=2072972 RepID=A0A0P1F5I5_9RHOB|nr:serine hydroxymethyltransferase [Thalassovita autumnalis]CUH72040.1 serine hydroxymethyltransferase [Thalassovita autumnalis]